MLEPALLVQAWLSPAFPVGAFAYSHGIEWAVEAGLVQDAVSCRTWIADLVTCGSWRNDAILAAAAWKAVTEKNISDLEDIVELAAALAPSLERSRESLQQGNAFMVAIHSAWPHPALANLDSMKTADIAYPVALGACAAVHEIPLDIVLRAYGLSFAQNLISAVIRLSVIGHTDGQKILAALLPTVTHIAETIMMCGVDDLGSATVMSDICSLKHETQYTRFFRS